MALQVAGQVVKGTLPAYAAGSNPPASQDQFGAVLISELNARYANLVLAGLVFGAQYASAATAAASATASGAFSLWNPANSGKNLVLLDAALSLNALPGAATNYIVGIQPSPNQNPTTVTSTTVISNLLIGSGNTPAAKAVTAATLIGSPTAVSRVMASWYADLVAGDLSTFVKDQIDGAVIVAPGSLINIVSVAATPTIVLGLTWAELPTSY